MPKYFHMSNIDCIIIGALAYMVMVQGKLAPKVCTYYVGYTS